LQPILKIDLTRGVSEPWQIPAKWQEQYLGGASLAARILYNSLTRELEPFSPQAPLLYLTGPLTGTLGPSVGRFVVCGKSPLTGIWAESNCGGFWGAELRFTGYDGLWITGKSEKPVYLWVNDGRVEIRDASLLWGGETYATQEAVKTELGDPRARVLVIGPAAERGVLFAGMFCDHGRTAGRTGLGAVMGSKNLKAIAVRGSGKPPLAEPERYAVARARANRDLKEDNQAQVLHDLGTSGVADYSEYIGAMPVKYYHRGSFPEVDKISGSTMAETILVGKSACHGCVIACGRVVELETGKRQKGPEYETVEIFGPNLLHADLRAVTRLGDLCDRYGFDTISAGNTIGLAFHLFEMGIITEKDTDGLTLAWGDGKVIEELVHKIGRQEGIGVLLGKGSRIFGRHFGAEEEAVQVNGLEVACHDPRGASGMALTYATSPRGACHNQSDYFFVDWGHSLPELGIEAFDRHGGSEKSASVALHQNWRTINNALVMCHFAVIPSESVVELVNAAGGWKMTLADLLSAGERGWNLKRAINIRLGLTGADDRLPKALLEPVPDGNSAGFVPDFAAMLSAYYQARGWDPVTGKPTLERMNALGMPEIASDLWA